MDDVPETFRMLTNVLEPAHGARDQFFESAISMIIPLSTPTPFTKTPLLLLSQGDATFTVENVTTGVATSLRDPNRPATTRRPLEIPTRCGRARHLCSSQLRTSEPPKARSSPRLAYGCTSRCDPRGSSDTRLRASSMGSKRGGNGDCG